MAYYKDYESASNAVVILGIKTSHEYERRYREDPRLPSSPQRYYDLHPDKADFKIFSQQKLAGEKSLYTYNEASEAVQRMGIKTRDEYSLRYNEDIRLPFNLKNTYKDYVSRGGWRAFSNTLPNYYQTYDEALSVVQGLGITNRNDYNLQRQSDERLPASPAKQYSEFEERGGWNGFLSTILKYTTYEEASEAAIRLNILTSIEYYLRYKEDPNLPCEPRLQYSTFKLEGGWRAFLKTQNIKKTQSRKYRNSGVLYPDFASASKAAKTLKIRSSGQYCNAYKIDERLPSRPPIFYKDFYEKGGWSTFLGAQKKKALSFEQVSKIAQTLGIKSSSEYTYKHKLDPRLPSNPQTSIKEFKEYGGWRRFLNKSPKIKLLGYKAASTLAITSGITSSTEYRLFAKFNPSIPSKPSSYYKDFTKRGGWKSFLDTKRGNKYTDIHVASKAAIALGIKTRGEYLAKFKLDPRLPAMPPSNLPEFHELGGWAVFLNNPSIKQNYHKGIEFYATYTEASEAAIKLGAKTGIHYRQLRNIDPKLHNTPANIYPEFKEKGGWQGFLGNLKHYWTIEQASQAAIALGIKTRLEYFDRYKEDPLLPPVPSEKYAQKFSKNGSWEGFLKCPQTEFYPDYESARKAAIALGINHSKTYTKVYKADPRLPGNPNLYYKDFKEKGGFRTFLGRPPLYTTFNQASLAAKSLKIARVSDYIKMRKFDPSLPSNPKTYFADFESLGGWKAFLQR